MYDISARRAVSRGCSTRRYEGRSCLKHTDCLKRRHQESRLVAERCEEQTSVSCVWSEIYSYRNVANLLDPRVCGLTSGKMPIPNAPYSFRRGQDWAPLGFPSLCWLCAKREASLGQRLVCCLRARDGSLSLEIAGRKLRPEGFIPVSGDRSLFEARLARTAPKSSSHAEFSCYIFIYTGPLCDDIAWLLIRMHC